MLIGNIKKYQAYQTWKGDEGVEFFDPSLDDSSSPWKLNKCLRVALLCVQENPDDRPSMLDIFSMLRDETKAIASPKKPAFSKKNDVNVGSTSTSTSQQAGCSANYLPISDVMPR